MKKFSYSCTKFAILAFLVSLGVIAYNMESPTELLKASLSLIMIPLAMMADRSYNNGIAMGNFKEEINNKGIGIGNRLYWHAIDGVYDKGLRSNQEIFEYALSRVESGKDYYLTKWGK